MTWEVREGDSLELLRAMSAESVHCVVTSPPYWNLRDYGVAGQLGLERTPDEYVARLVEVFGEVRRVLREDGTLWLNLGDSYASGGRGGGMAGPSGEKQRSNHGALLGPKHAPEGLKDKDLIGIPWRVAFALQADRWWLRSDIIWSKPNPMPESVTDRPTKAHEYLFLLAKAAHYYYDAAAIAEPVVRLWDATNGGSWAHPERFPRGSSQGGHTGAYPLPNEDGTRNARSVWTVATQPFAEAHFATFPEALVEPCIKAGTSDHGACMACGVPWIRIVEKSRTFESGSGRSGNLPDGKNGPDLQGGGETLDIRRGPVVSVETVGWEPTCHCRASEARPCIVLDPFCGSGTTGMVALRRGRGFIGLELNPDYCELARRRISDDCPLFNTPAESPG